MIAACCSLVPAAKSMTSMLVSLVFAAFAVSVTLIA